jgi:tight adherence protein C
MSWSIAIAWVLSAILMIGAVWARTDPKVTAALDAPPRRKEIFPPRPPIPAAIGLALAVSVALVDPVVAILTAPVLVVTGYRLPAFLAARREARRREEANRTVPELLDVVAVAATAGLSPRLALERAVDVAAGPLADDLNAVRRAVEFGGTWQVGLQDVARSRHLHELRSLAVLMDQGRRLGVPVAVRLRELAREVRAERRLRREERARRAPVTMLFPLVFLILPAFVLAAVVPAVLVALRGAS